MLSKWLDEKSPNKLPGYATHYIGCGGAVVNAKNEVLLVMEKFGNPENRWSFPGGRSDHNETIEEAALREVYEELGIRCKVIDLLVMRESKKSIFGKADIFFSFLMRPLVDDVVVKQCKDELQAYKWVPLSEIDKFLAEDTFSIYHVQQRIIKKISELHKTGTFDFSKDCLVRRTPYPDYPVPGNLYTVIEPKISK